MRWRLSGRPREEIEEVVSGLWARLFQNGAARLRGYRGKNGAALSTWLSAVARNAATDYLRRNSPSYLALDGPWSASVPGPLSESLPDPAPGPLERIAARETRREILLAVKNLPRIYRKVIYARFYKRLPAAETAAACGIDEDTVYVRVARAFAKLRKDLAARGLAYECVPRRAVEAAPRPHRHFSGGEVARLMETVGKEAAERMCRACRGRSCPICRKTFLSTVVMWQAFSKGGRYTLGCRTRLAPDATEGIL